MSSYYGNLGFGDAASEANALLDELAKSNVAGSLLSPFNTAAERQLAVATVKKTIADQQAEIASLKSQLKYAQSTGGSSSTGGQAGGSGGAGGQMLNQLLILGIVGVLGYFAYRSFSHG